MSSSLTPSASSTSSTRRTKRQRIEIKIDSDDEDDTPPAQILTPGRSAQTVIVPARAQLNEQQLKILDLVRKRENVLYTGPAGCGKSAVTELIKAELHDLGKHVDIIAPTGIAAVNVGGMTLHAYVGWTPNDKRKTIGELRQKAKDYRVRKRLRRTDVLIIDEISMIENENLERLHHIMVDARNKDLPFGGVQMVVTGDFCQLGPVKPWEHCMKCGKARKTIGIKSKYVCDNQECPSRGVVLGEHEKWAFHSEHFVQAQFRCVLLTTVYRQHDAEFKRILFRLWLGKPLKSADRRLLSNHPTNMTSPVKLNPTRREVAMINSTSFERLPGSITRWESRDQFVWNEEHRHLEWKGQRSSEDGKIIALQNHRYEPLLELRIGARVLLLVNLDIEKGLVNGSTGKVVGFKQYNVAQLPRPSIQIDDTANAYNDNLERGVAEFRPMLGGDYSRLRYEEVKRFINSAEEAVWPVVEFDNGITQTIFGDCSVQTLGDDEPYSLLLRSQIPLHLAYAFTIHKCQGMTLGEVEVDLSKTFEDGQAYVAISRAKTMAGLRVRGMEKGYACGNKGEEVHNWLYDTFEALRPYIDAD